MSVIFGFETEEIKSQPALVLSRSENGSWTANHEVIFTAADFAEVKDKFAKGELLSSIDPDIPEPFDNILVIDTVSIARIEGDLYQVSINAVGSFTDQYSSDELAEGVKPTYDMQGTLVEVPFSQHPKWANVSEEERDSLNSLMTGRYSYNSLDNVLEMEDERGIVKTVKLANQLTSPDAIEFAKEIAAGNTSYSDGSLTWTETAEGKSPISPAQLAKLGKVSNPRGGAPNVGGRNWMLSGASQSKVGEVYKTSLEWTLSPRVKWSEFLYED